MVIKSITLKNIRSHVNSSYVFNSGINFISGANGAGKTTIIEAIGLCLFNAKPIMNIADYFLRYGQTKGEIAVCVELAGQALKVVCRVSKQGKKRFIFDEEGAELNLHGDEDIDSFLKERWNTEFSPEALFDDVIGVRQGTFCAPFLESPAVRKQKFGELLRVSEYAAAAKKGGALRDYARGRLEEVRLEQGKCEAIAQELEPTLLKLDELAAELQKLEDDRLAKQKQSEEACAASDQYSEIKQKYADAERALERSTTALHILQNDYKAAQASVNEALSAQELCASLRPIYDAYEAAQAKQGELEQIRERQSKAQSELNGAIHKVQIEQERLKASEQNSQKQFHAISEEEKQIKEEAGELEDIAKLQAQKNEAEQALGAAQHASAVSKKNLDEHRADRTAKCEISDLQEKSATLAAKLDKLAKDSRKFKEGKCPYTDGDCDTVQGLFEDAQAQIEAGKSEHAAVQGEIKALNEARDGIEKALSQIVKETEKALQTAQNSQHEKINALHILQNKLENIKKREDGLKNRRSALEVDAFNQQKMKAQIIALIKAQETAQAELGKYSGLGEELAQNRKVLDESKEGHKKYLLSESKSKTLEECQSRLSGITEQGKSEKERNIGLETVLHKLQKPDEQQEKRIKSALLECRSALSEITTRWQERTRQRAELYDKAQKLTTFKQRAEELKAEYVSLERTTGTVAKLFDILKNAGGRIGGVYAEKVGKRASAVYRSISGQNVTVEWTTDYEILLQDTFGGEQRTRVFKQLSGGEQMSVALAVRIALLLQLSSVGLAFFDEPTASLDALRRDALSSVIAQATAGFEQVFLVSHDNTFDSITQNVLQI